MSRPSIKLRPGDRKNFETLRAAVKNGDLALVSAIRKSDDTDVALVCAMSQTEDGDICPMPIAVMIEGNPFEEFEDPTAVVTFDEDDYVMLDPSKKDKG